jgi:hypothetical protein
VNASWPGGDPRDIARAIVASPPYSTHVARAAQGDLIDDILHWIGDRVAPLFAAIGHVLGASAAFAPWIGLFVSLAAFAAIVALALRLTDRWIRARPRVRERAPVRAHAMRGSGAWLALAQASARDERWRDAAAALVQAASMRLDELGRLPFDSARTPAEVRRALHDPAFDGFARDADVALFAASGATPERFARMRAAYATFGGEA